MTISTPSSASWLDDGATTYAPTAGGIQTSYGKVSDVARIIDLGSAVTPWHGVAAFEPSILDESSGNEVYQLYIEGSTSADFSGTKRDLASWTIGAVNPQDVIALSNVYDSVVYRYIRLKMVVSGTTPEICVKAFVRPLSSLDAYTLVELITLQHVLAQNTRNANTNFRAWMAGGVNGGPNGDGKYPLSDGLGNTVLVACPARIAAEGGNGYGNSLRQVSVGSFGTNEAALNAAAAAAYDTLGVTNKVLVGNAGAMQITGYKNWENRNIDLPPLVIQAKTNIGATASPVLPTSTYHEGDPDPEYGVETTIVGPIIDIGGETLGNQSLLKRLHFVGRRFNQSMDTLAIRIKDDQRAVSKYDITVTDHRGDAVELKDDTEKKGIVLHCSQIINGYPLTVRSTQVRNEDNPLRWDAKLSPDEIIVHHNHTANQNIYFGMDGVQASITHICNMEAITPAAGKYAAMVLNRKSEKWTGEIRNCTGRLMWVGSRYYGYTSAGCHLNLDLNVIQLLNGNVYLANPKNVTGRIIFNLANTHDTSKSNPLSDTATMTIGSVKGYCNLAVEMRRCTSPVGLELGDETYGGPWVTGSDGHAVQAIGLSFDNHTITAAIEMGTYEGAFVNPNSLTALRLRAGVNSTVNCPELAGNIVIKAGWQRGTINVPAAWVRSGGSVTINPLASTELIIHGAMDLAEVAAISWAFKGVKVLSVNDFEGIGAAYNGAVWVPMAPVTVPEVSLRALGSPYNDPAVKRKTFSLVNAGDAWPYFATGAERDAVWQRHGGTIAPRLLPETEAFEARVIAAAVADGAPAPSFDSDEDVLRRAIDRCFHDLIAANVYDFAAGIGASLMKALYAKMGPNLYFATTNMLFDQWPLKLHGGLTHDPTIGLVPPDPAAGAYSEVNGWASFPHGTTKYNIAILGGSEALLDADASADTVGGPFFSFGTGESANWRGTFHRLDGGNYSQLASEDSLPAPAITSGALYRIGMAWSPDKYSQSIYMFGGQPVHAAKAEVNEQVDAIYFGRARVGSDPKYLPTSLSFGGVASGTVSNEQVAAILRAVNTLRNALKTLP